MQGGVSEFKEPFYRPSNKKLFYSLVIFQNLQEL